VALQLPWTDLATQAPYPVAYWRIEAASGDLAANYIQAEVAIYVDAAKAGAGASPLARRSILFGPDELNAPLTLDGSPRTFREVCVAAMYLMLMLRPEFGGAVAV
jgi:hypothetical protein